MAQRKMQSMLNGALILTVTTVLVKIISAFYKMPLTDIIGGVARGYFTSAYSIYTPIYAIAMAGLPVAVARLVSQNAAIGRYRDVRMIFHVSLRIFMLTGSLGLIILLIIAKPYTMIADASNSLLAVLAIAPALLFCCIMSSYRGYYEGLRNMIPTGVSQVIEAIVKLALGLGLAYIAIKIGTNQFEAGQEAVRIALAQGLPAPDITVYGKVVKTLEEADSVIGIYSSAGAILGVTVGTVVGTLYLVLSHKISGDGITREQLVNSPRPAAGMTIAKQLIVISIPILASSLILNITNIIDTVTIQNRLASAIADGLPQIREMYGYSLTTAGIKDSDIKDYLWGAYGVVLDFRNLLPTIIVSLGVSALPALSAAWSVKDRRSIKVTVESVIRVTMLVALPAGFVMAVLAKPVLTFFYGVNNPDLVPIAAPIMAVYGYATALMSVSTPITNMLQGIGRTDVPVKSMVLGAVVKLVCNYVLVGNPTLNINGAAIGSILCYVSIVAINLIALLRETRLKVDAKSIFIKPLICSVFTWGATWAAYGLSYRLLCKLIGEPGVGESMSRLHNAGTIAMIIAGAISVIVYVLMLLLIRGISKDDINMLPKGKKIAKALEKHRLLG